MWKTPIRLLALSLMFLAGACANPQTERLCDLNELQPDHGVGKMRMVDGKPEPYWIPPSGEPRLIACDCADADPLRPLEFSDPVGDAERALQHERPAIYGDEGYIHKPPGWQEGDAAYAEWTRWEPYPWSYDAYPICFEFERLHAIAREYYARYNRAVLDGIRER